MRLSMNTDHIRELVDLMLKGGLTRLEIVEGNLKILLEAGNHASAAPDSHSITALGTDAPNTPMFTTLTSADVSTTTTVASVQTETAAAAGNSDTYVSPMVGVFYAAPSPDSKPFVQIGSRVEKGDVLCIIEAMKLMNELTADESGEILDICVSDGDIVEFGQTLFKIG